MSCIGARSATGEQLLWKLGKAHPANEHGQLSNAWILSDEGNHRKLRVYFGAQTESFEQLLAPSGHAVRSQATTVTDAAN